MNKAKETKINIRPMTREDIHEVLVLDRIVRSSERDVSRYEDVASINPGTPPDLSFVAEIDDKMVGFSINRSWYLMVPFTEVCIIHAILVHPDYRRHGIGRKLIEALVDHCQTEGIDTVRALIPRRNRELKTLFERQGFQRSQIMNFDRTFPQK